jgi:hypothetical protein
VLIETGYLVVVEEGIYGTMNLFVSLTETLQCTFLHRVIPKTMELGIQGRKAASMTPISSVDLA